MRTDNAESVDLRFRTLILLTLACGLIAGCGTASSTTPTRIVVEPTIVACAGDHRGCVREGQQQVRAAERKLARACPDGEVLLITAALTSARCVRSVPQPRGIETPKEVKRAGGRTLAEFEAGERVMVQSGCLACHRIGTVGNRGPGDDLTMVGARLSAARIERAITHAREPMPSYSRLPKPKLQALVAFLALLR